MQDAVGFPSRSVRWRYGQQPAVNRLINSRRDGVRRVLFVRLFWLYGGGCAGEEYDPQCSVLFSDLCLALGRRWRTETRAKPCARSVNSAHYEETVREHHTPLAALSACPDKAKSRWDLRLRHYEEVMCAA